MRSKAFTPSVRSGLFCRIVAFTVMYSFLATTISGCGGSTGGSVQQPQSQTITFTQPTSPVVFSPNLTIALSATGGASGNPVVFSVDAASTGKGTISGSTLTVTAAGTITVDANQAGNSSYNAAPQVSVSVTVNKATTTVSAWPTASAISSGQALSASTLKGGTASVSGSFAWTTPSTVPAVGTDSESVTFTPTDTTDYTTVTGSVNVVVTANQVAPTITAWPTASAISSGQALSASTLKGGTASVSGSFAWTTPSTVPAVGTDSESVTFTPTDTTDYTTVVGSVSVVVNPTTPQITGITSRYNACDKQCNGLSGSTYTITCAGCQNGDILHDASGLFPDITLSLSSGATSFGILLQWQPGTFGPWFNTWELQHPGGAYGNQWSTAFVGSASQSTLAISPTTHTLFQIEQKSGQVYYAKTGGATGALFSPGSGPAQTPNIIAVDDLTGNIAYVFTGNTTQVDIDDESGNLVCYLNTGMSFISSVAAKNGYIAFTDPTDNKVGIAKMDCTGYQTISVAGQPWAVAMAGNSAYILSRDKGANGVPTVTTITVATGAVTSTVDLTGITPVSTIRATTPYEGVYTIVASNQTPTIAVLFMADQTDGTVQILSTGTVGGVATKIAFAVPVPELPYILAMQDGSSSSTLLVGYILATGGEAVTHIGMINPTTGNYTPGVGACQTGLVGGLVATSSGVYCAGGSTIASPLTLP